MGTYNTMVSLHILEAAAYSTRFEFIYNGLQEFRTFVNHADKELWKLFESIDRNHNGEIDKDELKTAFTRAGVTISTAKLEAFFAEVDTNRDGVISYDEWR
jgi:solute carrier family 25 (mitochondrial phosphate transporter), member 23/24/25/41